MPLTDIEVLDHPMEVPGPAIVLPLEVALKLIEHGELIEAVELAARGLALSGKNIVMIEEDVS